MKKMALGVSSCLMGEPVRYDAGHKHDRYITDTLGPFFRFVPVCPEVEYGLDVPREPMRLVGDPANPRLVTIRTGIDHTRGMKTWAERRLRELETEDLSGFIFKSRSPSSGIRGVKVYTAGGMPGRQGAGIFGGAFVRRFPLMPVEDEGRLHDLGLRENFLERVFAYSRWREYEKSDGSVGGLVAFHTAHKLLIMAHSVQHYRAMGRLVANARRKKPENLRPEYAASLMEALRLIATVRKNTNVLQHVMGYFKKLLSPDEKQELLEVIGQYHKGLVPLIVPVTLLGHYVRKFDEPYLKGQHYLNPHPLELKLRNHA
jgi:uncharacterized protein YbgA (DUF1722 family)/uncharacterized protein YbbK (DUF523 family)